MAKVALVTGANSGIGKETILELAKAGFNCVINYIDNENDAINLKKQVEYLNVKCLAIKADVSNEVEVDNMVKQIEETFGGVDILVNNAAVDLSCMFNEKSVKNFKKTLDINLLGAYIVAKRVYKHMLDNHFGRIVNIASTNGINTYYPMCLEYDASKAALISLTHNLAIQFAPYITVNAIAPGFIGTENELKGYDEEFLKSEQEKILLNRYGTPNEVAKLVRFLVSDDASYINNAIIRIDGGQYGS